jgi:hypothetical protein
MQIETDNYYSKTIETTFQVNNKANPNLYNFNIPSKTFEDEPFTIPFPPTSNNMEGLFTYSSSNESVATIYGNTITIVDAGETIIAATQQETSNYNLETIVTLFEVNESTETSPTVIESDLEYFLNSTATYGNIINSIIIETELLTSSYKIIFSNNKNNKIIKIIR